MTKIRRLKGTALLKEVRKLRRVKRTSFDPEGSGYDDESARAAIKKYPLTVSQPKSYQGQTVQNEGSFQSWQWHPESQRYMIHSGSRNPDTGQILKGRRHKTYRLTEKGEEEAGYEVYRGKDNKYYSRKKKAK